MTDSYYKERNFNLALSPQSISALSFAFPPFSKTGERKQKREASFLQLDWVSGPGIHFVLTFAVMAHPPVAVFALALVRARCVVAGGKAAAVALTWGALVHIWRINGNIKIFSNWLQNASDITVEYQRLIAPPLHWGSKFISNELFVKSFYQSSDPSVTARVKSFWEGFLVKKPCPR